jgi:hypothetical protein
LALVAGVVALVCGFRTPLVHACKSVQPPPHALDPTAQASDTTAPGMPSVAVYNIRRGKGPETNYSSCSQSASSCDDLGSISLQVSAQDDQTAVDKMGYQVALATGQLPSGMTLPTGAVRTLGGMLFFGWIDGAKDDQESISFSLTISAVDLAGNIGPATTVEIHDGGSGGCTIGPSPLSAWPCTTLLILLLSRWLRARRPTTGPRHPREG